MQSDRSKPKQRENPIASLFLNILIPSIIMVKGSKWFVDDGVLALGIALIFPIGYGVYDFIKRRKYNFISIIGFVSILLTGGIGLLQLPSSWIPLKEALIPALIGVAVLASQRTQYPLIKTFILNEELINLSLINTKLSEEKNEEKFSQLLNQCTYFLAGSFAISALLNYILAKALVKSPSGTTAFTEELGKMNLLAYPVIFVPCLIILIFTFYKLMKGIKNLTGLSLDDLLIDPKK